MLSIKPKIASTNILEDVLPPMAIIGHFDRYRKIIVLNLLRYFIRPYPLYFQTNGFCRPVSAVATTLLPLREVWDSFLGPVKSYTVSPVTCHRCDIFWKFEAVLPRQCRSSSTLGPPQKTLSSPQYLAFDMNCFRFFQG